jgi:hypothetical protein
VDAQPTVVKPSSWAADKATATTRSLNECVGFPLSSLTHSFFIPRAAARLSALTSLVMPGLRFCRDAMSAGTGSSGAYRHIDCGPVSMSAWVTVPKSYATSSGPKHSMQA